MTRRSLTLPCLCLYLLAAAAAASSASASLRHSKPRAPVTPAAAADFVRRSCRATQYPRACELSLVPRAPDVGLSPRRLAQAALADAADRAHSCSAYIGPPSGEGGAMRDCAETLRDAAERLRQSTAELCCRNMGRATSPRFAWQLSNVQTWASAALTDADTCLDSLATYGGGGGGGAATPRDDVRRRVVAVEQATSIALALVNQLQPPRNLHQ